MWWIGAHHYHLLQKNLHITNNVYISSDLWCDQTEMHVTRMHATLLMGVAVKHGVWVEWRVISLGNRLQHGCCAQGSLVSIQSLFHFSAAWWGKAWKHVLGHLEHNFNDMSTSFADLFQIVMERYQIMLGTMKVWSSLIVLLFFLGHFLWYFGWWGASNISTTTNWILIVSLNVDTR